jgi:hypothetical protein
VFLKKIIFMHSHKKNSSSQQQRGYILVSLLKKCKFSLYFLFVEIAQSMQKREYVDKKTLYALFMICRDYTEHREKRCVLKKTFFHPFTHTKTISSRQENQNFFSTTTKGLDID